MITHIMLKYNRSGPRPAKMFQSTRIIWKKYPFVYTKFIPFRVNLFARSLSERCANVRQGVNPFGEASPHTPNWKLKI